MMNHPEFPVVSFLLIPLLSCSLPSHIRAGSISLIGLCLWLIAANLIHGVNSLVWAGNVAIQIPVWCDITMNVLVGFTAGVPLSVLCVSRQLESISSGRQATFTFADKRRRMKIEFGLCFIVPLFWMVLHYVFQGHRFDIIEDIGCNPATYNSIYTIIFYNLPPVLISLISIGYSLTALHHFLKKRIEFLSMLRSSPSAMTPSRYFRLLLFVFSDIFVNGISTSLIVYFNVLAGPRPYVNWTFVHSHYSSIGLFPRILIPNTTYNELLFGWWVTPVGSCLFFLLFSFSQEARSDYIVAWHWIKRRATHLIPQKRPGLPYHRQNTFPEKFQPPSSNATLVRPRTWDKEPSLKEVLLTSATRPGNTPEILGEQTIDGDTAVVPLPAHLTYYLPSEKPHEPTNYIFNHYTPKFARPLKTSRSIPTLIPDHPIPLPVHFPKQTPRPFSAYTI